MSSQGAFPGFSLRLTRWGGLYLGALLLLALAAVNTGNNALMMLLALALGSFGLSGTWSRQVLKSVRVRVVPPREVWAGRATAVDLVLENGSRLFPAYGLVLRGADGEPLLLETCLGRRSSRRRTVTLTFPRRGWQSLGPWRLEVLLPLGFFLKSKRVADEDRVLVYPRLLGRAGACASRDQGHASPRRRSGRGREGEVTQLRLYRDGDERRQIHWKQSARQQQLIVVDRQAPAAEPLFLVLDPRVEDVQDPVALERLEEEISQVATAAAERLRRGEPVGLIIGSRVVPPVLQISRGHLLMRPLAEVGASPMDDPEPHLPAPGAETWAPQRVSA